VDEITNTYLGLGTGVEMVSGDTMRPGERPIVSRGRGLDGGGMLIVSVFNPGGGTG